MTCRWPLRKMDVIHQRRHTPFFVRSHQPDVIAASAAESKAPGACQGRIELAFVKHHVLTWLQHGGDRDLVLQQVVNIVTEEPAANVDGPRADVCQLNRVAGGTRWIRTRQHFVDRDAHGFCCGGTR